MSDSQAILFGYYGARNIGDELMLLCLNRWLERQNIRTTVGAIEAREVERLHGLPALQDLPLLFQYAWVDVWLRGKGFELLRRMRDADVILAGGGDFIRDDRGWKHFSSSIEKLMTGSLMGKPVGLVNVGIGRPQTKYGNRWLRSALRRCSRIIVRDRRSYDLCQGFGVGSQTTFTVDIVMCLRELLGVNPSGRRPVDGRYVVVALRSNPNVYNQYAVGEQRLRSIAAALDKIAAGHGYKIVFVPFHGGVEDDNAIHRSIVGMMRQRDAAVIRDWTMDVQELVDIFSGAETTVAMRLHAAILSLAVGRDCTVLPYDQKVRELCSEMRLQHVVEADSLDDSEFFAQSIENSMGGQWQRPGHFPSWSELTLTA
jgi:polysaccharide pyruvyl transferase CsaB